MALIHKYPTKFPNLGRICFLCTKNQQKTLSTSLEEPSLKPPKIRYPSHLTRLNKFFGENIDALRYKKLIPSNILSSKPYKNPDYLYLVVPHVANDIASHIQRRLRGANNRLIIEANPGLGLISNVLLQSGTAPIRLFEANDEFVEYLQKAFKNKRAEIVNKDIFDLPKYSYIDRKEKSTTVATMLEGIPTKSWTDDPALVIIGTANNYGFLRYLIKCVILQTDIALNGRTELYLVMYKRHWHFYSEPQSVYNHHSKYWIILIKLFFDAELINKYPRKCFVPWESVMKNTEDKFRVDQKNLYLIRFVFKKELPVTAEQFVPFYCFMMHLYGSGTSGVIASCEKWVPGSGENIIIPPLVYYDYLDDINIFTSFNDLNLNQILAVFHVLSSHPNYRSSPFSAMIEQEWMKTETIDT